MDHSDMKPCPFCGRAVDMDDPDTLYPSGTFWYNSVVAGCKAYAGRKEFREYGQPDTAYHPCFSMNCPEASGGCGVRMSGDSKQEAIDNWNRRA